MAVDRDEHKEPLGKSKTENVRCLLLFNAKNYKKASTRCPDTSVSCQVCSIKLALDKNPSLTHAQLTEEVVKMG
jgi:hypothetical protein